MKTAVVVQMKQRQATLRDQCVEASSRLNRTPPMGAPKAACTSHSLFGTLLTLLMRLPDKRSMLPRCMWGTKVWWKWPCPFL